MIMSVEVAIQTELAYRAKIAKSLSPSDRASFLEKLMPLEVHSFSASPIQSPMLPEISWQAPTGSSKFSPTPQPHEIETQIDSTFSMLQYTSANSSLCPRPRPYSSPSPMLSRTTRQAPPPAQLLQHEDQIDYTFCKVPSSSSNPNPWENSVIQQQPSTSILSLPPPLQPYELGNQMDYTYCKVCQVPCSGYSNYKQHIKGKKHWSRLQELRFAKEDCADRCVGANQRKYCGLCKLWCMDAGALKLHLAGQKHRDQLVKLAVGGQTATQRSLCVLGKEGSSRSQQKHWCNECKIWCIDKDSLVRHKQGKKHIFKLHEIEKERAMLGGKAIDRK